MAEPLRRERRIKNRGMTFAALGDSAVTVTLGPRPGAVDASRRVRVLAARPSERAALPMVVDIVPAYATVTVFYDPARWAGGLGSPFEDLCRAIDQCAARLPESGRARRAKAPAIPRQIEIPVCYGGDFGPDLAAVAAHARLEPEDVARRHSGADYDVQAIGFAPGFPTWPACRRACIARDGRLRGRWCRPVRSESAAPKQGSIPWPRREAGS